MLFIKPRTQFPEKYFIIIVFNVRCVYVYSLNTRVFLPQSPEAPSVLVNHKWDHYGEETNDSFKVDLPLPRAYNHYYGR